MEGRRCLGCVCGWGGSEQEKLLPEHLIKEGALFSNFDIVSKLVYVKDGHFTCVPYLEHTYCGIL